jgi:hypothetical protein
LQKAIGQTHKDTYGSIESYLHLDFYKNTDNQAKIYALKAYETATLHEGIDDRQALQFLMSQNHEKE